MDEVIAATAYIDLFIRTISEEKFRKLFLKFILYTKIEDVYMLDTLISRINSNNRVIFRNYYSIKWLTFSFLFSF